MTTNRDVERWLLRGRWVKAEITQLEARIREANERATSITSAPDAVVVQGTKDPHKFDRLCELTEELWEQKQKLDSILAEIQRTIDSLEDSRERQVCGMYYIDGMPVTAIAEQLYCSAQNVYAIKRRARKKIRDYKNL